MSYRVGSPTVRNTGHELGRWFEQSSPPTYLLALNGSTGNIDRATDSGTILLIDSRGPRIASRLIGLVAPIALGQAVAALPSLLDNAKREESRKRG